MKNLYIISILFIAFLISSCGTSRKTEAFNEKTVHHNRIAIIPLESSILLTEELRERITEEKLHQLEYDQSIDVQRALTSYLVNKKLTVNVQSTNVTNARLIESGIDLALAHQEDYTKLCTILNVDAIVCGVIETEKPMTEELATVLNIAKVFERQILNSGVSSMINTSTNKGFCRLDLFEGTHGDQLWSYKRKLELSNGSTTQDIINRIMKTGSRKFPYRI